MLKFNSACKHIARLRLYQDLEHFCTRVVVLFVDKSLHDRYNIYYSVPIFALLYDRFAYKKCVPFSDMVHFTQLYSALSKCYFRHLVKGLKLGRK